MQLILAAIVFVVEFLQIYLLADLISLVFKITVTRKQKALFAFFTGTLLQNCWIYGVYLIGNAADFSRLQLQLVACPNPVAALLYCYCAIKIFKLSPIRSIKTMGYVYLFWFICKKINGILGYRFFPQTGPQYNYLADALQQISMLIVFTLIYRLIKYFVRHKQFSLNFAENYYANPKRELLVYFLRSTFAYCLSVALAMTMPTPLMSSIVCSAMLILFFAVVILTDMNRYSRQVVENSNVHISTLFKGNEEFRGIKHDFYNILQTYSGYLEIGDIEKLKEYHKTLVDTTVHAGASMELGQRIQENPALVSLLMNKADYAEKSNVKLQLSLRCSLANNFIDNMDLCRMVSCLLDNAIESAAASAEKKVYVSSELKNGGAILFIITNSTDIPVDTDRVMIHGLSDKPGHSGIGLSSVRNTVDKYRNCAFRMAYYNYEVSTYLELKKE